VFRLKVVTFTLLATLACTVALAQSPSSGTQQDTTGGQAARHERRHDRLEWLTKELHLTDEQKEKLKPILQDEAKQMRAIHEDGSLTPDQKRDKAKQIREKFRPQIQAVLTPEQQEKLKNLKEEAREQRQGKEEMKH
jgi:protein CpxP